MRLAFVIQLDPKPTTDWCEGRIEHVDSGHSQHFHSIREAVNFARRVLTQVELDEQEMAIADFKSQLSDCDEL